MFDKLFINLHAATMADQKTPYGAICDAAIAVQDGKIAWIGKQKIYPMLQKNVQRKFTMARVLG